MAYTPTHRYLKYLQILRKLEVSYDNMTHPQKRADTLQVLELVMRAETNGLGFRVHFAGRTCKSFK